MHNAAADGNDYFVCDFCGRAWSEDRPMVEGHRGSLICGGCLTVAYGSLVHAGEGESLRGGLCVMCLEQRDQPQWQSPAREHSRACIRCVRQAAGVMSKDPDTGWKRPEPAAGVRPVETEAAEEDVDEGNV